VIKDDKQLEGEREQRAPGANLQVRSNPAHSGVHRVATAGNERLPAIVKEVGAPAPFSKLL
jgi:hypothetical protein